MLMKHSSQDARGGVGSARRHPTRTDRGRRAARHRCPRRAPQSPVSAERTATGSAMVVDLMSGQDTKSKYKDTVILPETPFPMRGDLAKREPEILAQWEASKLYERIGEARA